MSFNEETIWDLLKKEGFNNYGVAGLMGNLYAESGLVPTNLENYYNSQFGLSDEEYTKRVDNKTYTNFVYDSAGYGLAQWTYWSRKKDLLDYAAARNTSIGDGVMQVGFLIQELKQSFPSVYNTLKNASSVFEASNAVLLQFERPADQSNSVQVRRANYGQQYYDKYANKIKEEDIMTQEKFNEMMNAWLEKQANINSNAEWSKDARQWAESNGFIQGDEKGRTMYKKFMTREEMIVVLHRILKAKGLL